MTAEHDEKESDTLQRQADQRASIIKALERRPVLTSLRGELLATPIPLERDIVTIGRALDADIRVKDFKAVRLHAPVCSEPIEGGIRFRLKDLGSTNGTLVNGQVVREALLNNGDKILIGDHLFRFELLDEIDHEFQQQIHRLIGHDDLTGLLTSKSFFTELNREAARAEIENQPFCVLMMDLDHFKLVNDKYGHLVGSRTLQDVGVIIKAALRSGDVAARFGGEEFAAFLLDADYAQALVAAERVRAAIEAHLFSGAPVTSADSTQLFRITISIGISAFPDDSKEAVQLVEMADSALYRAKRNGRNMICAYRPSVAATEKPLRPRRG